MANDAILINNSMNHPSINISTTNLAYWFNALRDLPDDQRTRALDAFWSGQLDSKAWLVKSLNLAVVPPSNIYIFGGWIGVLASMLFAGAQFDVKKIRSIDIDPWCEPIADMVCKPQEMNEWRFKARTANMSKYEYEYDISPDVVINTSSEHVTQRVYNAWYKKIPSGSLVVVQGNNFFDCSEHVRCSASLEEFKKQNNVVDPIFEGSLPHDLYTRYMCMWRK